MKKFSAKESVPTKYGFGKGVEKAGELNKKVIVLGADITTSVGLNFFKEKFPERFFSIGIAEQNCIGIAAGLALADKIPVFSTYGVFAALRPLDQIRVSVCYNNLHVIIGGAHAGISVGADGATHQALEDIAIMRSLPNMTIISPCDSNQAEIATIDAIEKINGPVYIRFGREAVPNFTSKKQKFDIGKSQTLKEGNDISIFATGNMVWDSLQAAYELQKVNIDARVINIHTIKPIDSISIIKAAQETGAIISAEEHQISGGLGSAIAEIVVRNHPVPMDFIGMNDSFGESGTPVELMSKYKMTAKDIFEKTRNLFDLKKKI